MIGHADTIEADSPILGERSDVGRRLKPLLSVIAILALVLTTAAVVDKGLSPRYLNNRATMRQSDELLSFSETHTVKTSSSTTGPSDASAPAPVVASLLNARSTKSSSSKDQGCYFFWRGLCAQTDCGSQWMRQGSCADAGYPVCCVGYWGPHNGWYKQDQLPGRVGCEEANLKPCSDPDERDEFLRNSQEGGSWSRPRDEQILAGYNV